MTHNILTPKYNNNGIFLRQIRSFVCRKGRITKSQLNGIEKYWQFMGINFQKKPLDFFSIFNSNSSVILEIGFGSGDSLVQTAINFPNKNFLGIEVYKSGIGACLNLSYSYNIKNLRLIYHDAVEVMKNMILDRTVSMVQIFFPDPWHKKRHHKRRMLQKCFLEIIAKKLMIGGILHVTTDLEEYAFYILDEIKEIDMYINLSKNKNFITNSLSPIMTKFEKKAYLRGNKIFDLMFKVIQ